jgi:hypothetical protein
MGVHGEGSDGAPYTLFYVSYLNTYTRFHPNNEGIILLVGDEYPNNGVFKYPNTFVPYDI